MIILGSNLGPNSVTYISGVICSVASGGTQNSAHREVLIAVADNNLNYMKYVYINDNGLISNYQPFAYVPPKVLYIKPSKI